MISGMTANIHEVETVTLKRKTHNGTHWLEIDIKDSAGFVYSVTCFEKPTIDIQCPLWFHEKEEETT